MYFPVRENRDKEDMKYYSIYILLILGFVFSSCNDEMTKSFEAKPVALARMNEIIVVTDEDAWKGELKDTVKYYFESAYPIMPTPEPMFDLRYFSPEDLDGEPLRKELRTYLVVVDLSDAESPATKMLRRDLGEERYLRAKSDPTFQTSVGKDKWARGQIIIYLFANGKDKLYEAIRKNYPAIAKRVRLHDSEQLEASIYSVKKENLGLTRILDEKFGVEMNVPGDFIRAKEEEDFIWLKKDTKDATLGIVVKTIPYTSQDQYSIDNIIKLRDEYGKNEISSSESGSYMITNSEDLPVYDYTYEIDGHYTREIRGVWEMVNDYMGGPFATYMIQDPANGKIIFIDTFVYAPGKGKRDMMLQLEYIVKNAKLDS